MESRADKNAAFSTGKAAFDILVARYVFIFVNFLPDGFLALEDGLMLRCKIAE